MPSILCLDNDIRVESNKSKDIYPSVQPNPEIFLLGLYDESSKMGQGFSQES
jgi:hypothetical protein